MQGESVAGTEAVTQAGAGVGAPRGPPPRRGVLPGSFLDLMMQATDKTTGKSFSDFEIANQVCHRGYHEEVLV